MNLSQGKSDLKCRVAICMLSLAQGRSEYPDLLELTEKISATGIEVYWISFDALTAMHDIEIPAGVRWLRLCESTLLSGSIRQAVALATKLAPVLAYLSPTMVIPWQRAVRYAVWLARLASGTPVSSGKDWSKRFTSPARAVLQAVLLVISPKRYHRLRLQAQLATQAAHALLDGDWYAAQYQVTGSLNACLEHYLFVGQYLGCNPNPLFWATWYTEKYLANADITPCTHFFGIGAHGNYDPNPFFRTSWYRDMAGLKFDRDEFPVMHYLRSPSGAAIDPNPLFDTHWYMEYYSDARDSTRTPLEDFVLTGNARAPSPFFLQYPSVLADSRGHRLSYAALFSQMFDMRKPTKAVYEIGLRPDRPMRRFALCSVVTGDYDQPHPILYADAEVDYFLLTDSATSESQTGWKHIVGKPYAEKDPLKLSRFLKMHLMELVPNAAQYDAIAYIDGNLEIIGTLAKLFHDFADSSALIGLIRHPTRICAFQEAAAVLLLEKDTRANVMHTLEFLTQEGLPSNAGLYEMNFFMLRPTPEVARFFAEWWRLFQEFGNRDQLLAPYVLWKHSISIHYLVPEGVSVRTIGSLSYHPHNSPKVAFGDIGQFRFE